MSDYTRRQIDIMAAHLLDLAGIAARNGNTMRALDITEQAREILLPPVIDPESDYREGLTAAGVDFGGIDDAVAAVRAGEHPPGSLPAEVEEMRREVPYSGKLRHEGKVSACNSVTRWAGVKL